MHVPATSPAPALWQGTSARQHRHRKTPTLKHSSCGIVESTCSYHSSVKHFTPGRNLGGQQGLSRSVFICEVCSVTSLCMHFTCEVLRLSFDLTCIPSERVCHAASVCRSLQAKCLLPLPHSAEVSKAMYRFFAAGDEIRSRSPFLTAPEVQRLLVVATVHQAVHDLLRRWPGGGRPQGHKARPKLALAEPELQVVDLASLGVQASRVGTAQHGRTCRPSTKRRPQPRSTKVSSGTFLLPTAHTIPERETR